MSQIKAIFRGVAKDCQSTFKNSQCLLTISVGQATHEGELFDVTVDLINRSFGSCIILVDDSLQRHTMALDSPNNAKFFYEIAIREGDLWLERNKKYYSKLTIPTKFFRWDKWLKHPKFELQKSKIEQLIENDFQYKAAFDHSIEKFLKKYCERLSKRDNFNIQRAGKLSLDFVIEECTALTLWPELKCQFEVYPNKHNNAIQETRKRFILPDYPDLLRSVTICFRNAKQIKPQYFELL